MFFVVGIERDRLKEGSKGELGRERTGLEGLMKVVKLIIRKKGRKGGGDGERD